MSASIYKVNATGLAAINASLAVPAGHHYRLVSVSLNNSAAPTTASNFTVTLDANAGAVYDTLLYTNDLATTSVTSLIWWPDEEVFLEGGDVITVAYANPNNITCGVQITAKEV